MSHPVPTVGVVCLRGEEVLLIKRGTPPRLGQWSVPGGRLEWGEALQDAALRELKEETGGDPVAGDDAAEARFVTRDEAMALVEWEETRRVITEAVERFGGLPLP